MAFGGGAVHLMFDMGQDIKSGWIDATDPPDVESYRTPITGEVRYRVRGSGMPWAASAEVAVRDWQKVRGYEQKREGKK